jgi:hypothetical protein
MKITIEGQTYEMTRAQCQSMLTARAYKMINKVHRQGGSLSFGIGAFKPEFRAMIK